MEQEVLAALQTAFVSSLHIALHPSPPNIPPSSHYSEAAVYTPLPQIEQDVFPALQTPLGSSLHIALHPSPPPIPPSSQSSEAAV